MLQNMQTTQRLDTSVCRLCISDAASEADLVRASRLPTKLPCLSSFSSGVICIQHNQDFACRFVMKSEAFIVFMHKPERAATLSAAMHSLHTNTVQVHGVPKYGNNCEFAKQRSIQHCFVYMHIAVLLNH